MPDRGLEAGPGAPLGGVKGSEVSREEAQDRHTAPGQAAGLQAATAAQSPGWGRDGSVRQGGNVSVPFLALQGCTGGWGDGRRPPRQGAAEVNESVPLIVQMPGRICRARLPDGRDAAAFAAGARGLAVGGALGGAWPFGSVRPREDGSLHQPEGPPHCAVAALV